MSVAVDMNGHVLELVSNAAARAIEASAEGLRSQDRLTLMLRQAAQRGVDINALSEASGLTIAEIRRRVASDLYVLEDVSALAGAA